MIAHLFPIVPCVAIPYEKILNDLSSSFSEQDFPALAEQCRKWSVLKPFAGKRVLDSTPVFRNTCLKYAALIAGGAEVHVARPVSMPHDEGVLANLARYGIAVVNPDEASAPYHVVMDCAGDLANVPSINGYVELTKSGESRYLDCQQPVISVDSGMIKTIETSLGTGESFFRAMSLLGHNDWNGATLLVIGYGKVGRGIALHAIRQKVKVIVADIELKNLPEKTDFVPIHDKKRFNAELAKAYCAVTATGASDAMQGVAEPSAVMGSPVLLANMGVDDEWGGGIPESRILNAKKPLNFILPDPTLTCFIDPPMALHNACALELLTRAYPPGISAPPAALEREILDVVLSKGGIPPELLDDLLNTPAASPPELA